MTENRQKIKPRPKQNSQQGSSCNLWTGCVSKKTKEIVARAAEREGISSQKWVENVLREAAKASHKTDRWAIVLPEDLVQALDELSQRLKELSERRSLSDRALQKVKGTAAEVNGYISSTYNILIERVESTIREFSKRADKGLIEPTRFLGSEFTYIPRLPRRFRSRFGATWNSRLWTNKVDS